MIVAVAGVAALRPSPVAMTLCTAAIALVSPAVVVRTNARILGLVPDALMGRVQSSLLVVGGLLYPFATVSAGWLDERFSARGAMAVLTVVLTAVLTLTFLPGLRHPPLPTTGRTSVRRADAGATTTERSDLDRQDRSSRSTTPPR